MSANYLQLRQTLCKAYPCLLIQIYHLPTYRQSYRILMESIVENSSTAMVRVQPRSASRGSNRSAKVGPLQLLQKELDLEKGLTAYHPPKKIEITNALVFSPSPTQDSSQGKVLRLKADYWLNNFLQGVEIIGDNSAPTMRKVKGFPWSKYLLSDSTGCYELNSSLLGDKYTLCKNGICFFSIAFQMGCNVRVRRVDVYSLLDQTKWTSLEGVGFTQDLSQLYQKGHNFDYIEKYANLEPIQCPQTGRFYLPFSLHGVKPSEANTIICNMNGKRLLQMVKTSDCYQVNLHTQFPVLHILAFAVASLDFKIGLQ